MPETRRLPDSMAPCGVYCGAGPSFGKGCRGCGSENRRQRSTSKWNCRIRRCCFEEKGLALRSQCTEFPCKLTDRLQGSYPDDERFRYRHEIYENLREIQRQASMRGCLERKRSGAARCAGKRSSSTITGARHAGMSRTGTGDGSAVRETGRAVQPAHVVRVCGQQMNIVVHS